MVQMESYCNVSLIFSMFSFSINFRLFSNMKSDPLMQAP